MKKLLLLLCLLTTPAFGEDLECVRTDVEVICTTSQDEQTLDELSPRVVLDDSLAIMMPKSIIIPVMKVIVLEVAKSVAVDALKSMILEAFMRKYPGKPMPNIKLAQAH